MNTLTLPPVNSPSGENLHRIYRIAHGEWPIVGLLLLSFFLLLFRLGSSSLHDWDEGIYAQVSREILQTGDWQDLHWMGRSWYEKPPLFLWITAATYKLGGVNEWTARLPSALAAFGLFCLLPFFGKHLGSRWVGVFAILILLTDSEFMFRSRFGTMDVLLTLLIFVSLYGFMLFQAGNPRGWLLVGSGFGLAVMEKGAAAAVIPVIIVAALLLDGFERLRHVLRSREFWLGLCVAVIIVVPWHLMMTLRAGRVFWQDYMGTQVLSRATVGVASLNQGGRLYYLSSLQEYLFPWFFPGLFALAFAIRNVLRDRSFGLRLVLLTAGIIFGFYTVVRTKNPWYMIPLHPAIALLVSVAMVEAWKKKDVAIAGGFFVSGILNMLMAARTAAAILATVLIGVHLALRKKPAEWALAISAAVGVCTLLAGYAEIRVLYRASESDIAHLSKMVLQHFPDDRRPVVFFGYPYAPSGPGPAFAYYSGRPFEWADVSDRLPQYFQAGQSRPVILAQKDLREFESGYEFKVQLAYMNLVYGLATPHAVNEAASNRATVQAPPRPMLP